MMPAKVKKRKADKSVSVDKSTESDDENNKAGVLETLEAGNAQSPGEAFQVVKGKKRKSRVSAAAEADAAVESAGAEDSIIVKSKKQKRRERRGNADDSGGKGVEISRKKGKKKQGEDGDVNLAVGLPETVTELACRPSDEGTHGAASDRQQQQNSSLRGMRKWLAEYYAKRPGSDVLQRQIDDFIVDYDAGEKQAKLDREEAAAADGWTLVMNKGGRKKTTDSGGSITVGAVSAAVAAERAAKRQKKAGTTTLDFYRFQKREKRRNELLELQQKFENDKKRLAKLKAARKFTPF